MLALAVSSIYGNQQCPTPNPTFTHESTPVAPSQFFAEAAEVSRLLDGTVELQGDVAIGSEEFNLSTEYARVLDEPLSIHLPQDFRLYISEMAFEGNSGKWEVEAEVNRLDGVSYAALNSPARGTAKSLTKTADQIALQGTTFSTCTGKAWTIRAARIELDSEQNTFKMHHFRLMLWQVPIFYLPNISLRLEWLAAAQQESWEGFQLPILDTDSNFGVAAGIPYRVDIADELSLNVVPIYYTKRGWQLRSELERGNTTALFEWVPNDQGDRDTTVAETRWQIQLEHEQEIGSLETSINAVKASDAGYWRDFDVDYSRRTRLFSDSELSLSYRQTKFDVSLIAQRYESTTRVDHDITREPELRFRWRDHWKWFRLGADTSVARFHENRSFPNSSRRISRSLDRHHAEIAIGVQWENHIASVNVNGKRYATKFEGGGRSVQDFSINRNIDSFDSYGAIYFRQTLPFLDPTYEIQHSLRAYYLKRDFQSERAPFRFDDTPLLLSQTRLFSDQRQSGLDEIPGAHSLTLGVTTVLQEGASGTEIFDFTFALIDHLDGFEGDGLRVKRAVLDYGFDANWIEGRTQIFFDPSRRELQQSHYFVRLDPWPQVQLEIDHVFLERQQSEQLGTTAEIKLAQNWSVYMNSTIDLKEKRPLVRFVGFGYENCCLLVRGMLREARQPTELFERFRSELDSGVRVQIHLKGLGGIGSGVERSIQRAFRHSNW